MVLFCRENKGTLAITLHVQPRAKKTEIIGVHGESLKMKVAAPPVDGEANEELVRYFAKLLGVTKSQVEVGRGGKSRHKILEVEGVTMAEFTALLIKMRLLTIKLG